MLLDCIQRVFFKLERVSMNHENLAYLQKQRLEQMQKKDVKQLKVLICGIVLKRKLNCVIHYID